MYGVELSGGKGSNVVVSIMVVVVDESKCGTRSDVGIVDVLGSVKVVVVMDVVVVDVIVVNAVVVVEL